VIYLDTSALIRFFTKDDPRKAREVKNIIENEKNLHISDVVFPEIEYVLLSETYNGSRKKVLTSFKFLTSQKNISVTRHAKKAVEIYEKTSLDMADCLIAAESIVNSGELASFDKKLLKVAEVVKFFS